MNKIHTCGSNNLFTFAEPLHDTDVEGGGVYWDILVAINSPISQYVLIINYISLRSFINFFTRLYILDAHIYKYYFFCYSLPIWVLDVILISNTEAPDNGSPILTSAPLNGFDVYSAQKS